MTSSIERPWAGRLRHGFIAWVARMTRSSPRNVSAVLAGSHRNAVIEAYTCGALGVPLPETALEREP